MSMYRCARCGGLNRVPAQQPPGKRPVCGQCKQPLDTSGAPQDVNGNELARVIRAAQVPVLVDFWAPWCGPCRMVAPVVAEVARARAGELIVLKVNSDENPQPSAQHGIRGIPALLMFRGGREVGRQTGALPKAALDSWITRHL